MISQFVKRPASKHLSNLRPVTGEPSEQNKKQSDQCFQMGKKHMGKRQYDQALKHYTNATIHNPFSYKALCNMGKIYKEQGKYSQARSCYTKAILANQNDSVSLYNFANLERALGNQEHAISLYEKVINLKNKHNMEIGSLYYDSLINQGVCYQNLKVFDEAIRCNEEAIKISPNDQSAYFNKAMCTLQKIYGIKNKNYEGVRKKYCHQVQQTFKKVLQLTPNNFTAKIGIIQLKYLQQVSQQRYNNAIKQFQVLQKSVPQTQKFQISLKIKYCQNQLKRLNQIKHPPANEIKSQKTNKYDIQQKSTKSIQQVNKVDQSNKMIRNQSRQGAISRQSKNRKLSRQGLLQQKTQNNGVRGQIDSLIQQKKYEQAFALVQNLPDGMQKYQLQITINYFECLDEQNMTFLNSAISIYNQYVIKNDVDTPITKNMLTLRGHETMASMLTVSGNYDQASKHYEIILQELQSKKVGDGNNQKIKQIHAQLGVCYAQRGLLQQAITQYKLSLEMQPDNYFLMTNLGGLLIQDGQKAEAKKLYQNFLKKNKGQAVEDKVVYVDSLLNISICTRQSEQQQQAVEKTLNAIEKYFPSYESIKSKLSVQAILGCYLRYIQILQQKASKIKGFSVQKKQIYEKMLQKYLTCLQFQNCPDRQAMLTNVGTLFYLQGCYVNAINFYKQIRHTRKLAANNFGLTFLHLLEYEKALYYLMYAVQENPQSIIYAANLQIAKWMCGLNETNLVPKYNCKCQSIYECRVQFGLWMIDQITYLLDQNAIKAQNTIQSTVPVAKQVQNLIKLIIQRSQRLDKLQGRSQVIKSKIGICLQVLNKHMAQVHLHQQKQPRKLVNDELLELSLHKSKDSKQFQQYLGKILDMLNTYGENSAAFTIIQSILSIFFINNSQIQNGTQIIKQMIKKKLIYSSKPQLVKIDETKQNFSQYLSKTIKVNFPATQLNFRQFNTLLRQTQCMIQNASQFLIQFIQNSYYSQPQGISGPITKQYLHPHCQNSEPCSGCIAAASQLYSILFGKRTASNVNISKNWTISQQIKAFPEKLESFVNKALQSQQGKVFNKRTNEMTIKLQNKSLPFLIKTHHKTFADVANFIKKIASSHNLAADKAEKGVKIVILNEIVILAMYWGDKITSLDKFCQWLARRQTNLLHDGIILIGEQLKQIQDIFQNKQAINKINDRFYKN